MNPKEPPCGGRMLEKAEGDANTVERKPAPPENAVTNGQETPDSKARRRRKRRKPFVL